MKKISVVIPSFNSSATIVKCVKSVLENRCRPFEIIVVDDASTDNSPELVKGLVSDYPGTVKLLRSERNCGPAHARNMGAGNAAGDILFFLDSDTELQQDALSILAHRLESDRADAVGGIYHETPLNHSPAAVYKALLNNYFFSNRGVFEYEVFNGAVGGIRKEVFNEAGGYNESLEWGMDYENEDLGHRLQEKGYRVLIDPAVQARHAFPDMCKLTRTYFTRVALWMELFMKRRRFEAGGTAVAQNGIGSASVPVVFGLTALSAFWPWAWIGVIFFFFLYLRGYSGFLLFALRKKPRFFPVAFLLNLYFSTVIASGAGFGALRFLLRRRSQDNLS